MIRLLLFWYVQFTQSRFNLVDEITEKLINVLTFHMPQRLTAATPVEKLLLLRLLNKEYSVLRQILGRYYTDIR